MPDEQNPPQGNPPAHAPEPAPEPEPSEPEMELHEPSGAMPSGPGKSARFKAWLHEAWQKLREFSKECVRVVRITKKPDKQEYTTIIKISGIGILVIGFIGFLLHAAKELLF